MTPDEIYDLLQMLGPGKAVAFGAIGAVLDDVIDSLRLSVNEFVGTAGQDVADEIWGTVCDYVDHAYDWVER